LQNSLRCIVIPSLHDFNLSSGSAYEILLSQLSRSRDGLNFPFCIALFEVDVHAEAITGGKRSSGSAHGRICYFAKELLQTRRKDSGQLQPCEHLKPTSQIEAANGKHSSAGGSFDNMSDSQRKLENVSVMIRTANGIDTTGTIRGRYPIQLSFYNEIR
jgi:hypothetical protein